LIAGYLAQKVDWHIGFASAGVGMVLGVTQYIVGKERLRPALDKLAMREKSNSATQQTAFEWKRVAAVIVFFIFASLFWAAYEQAGSTLNLFADRYTRLSVFGFSFPSSWFQSVPAAFVILLAPLMAWLWLKLGSHEPSSPAKFVLGLLFAGFAFLLLVPAAMIAQGGAKVLVSPWWLVVSYFVIEIGELSLSPVGLSVVTKLAPPRIVGLMMGVWFLSVAVGDIIAGWAAGLFSTTPLPLLFGSVAAAMLLAAVILTILVRPIQRLMGGIQ